MKDSTIIEIIADNEMVNEILPSLGKYQLIKIDRLEDKTQQNNTFKLYLK